MGLASPWTESASSWVVVWPNWLILSLFSWSKLLICYMYSLLLFSVYMHAQIIFTGHILFIVYFVVLLEWWHLFLGRWRAWCYRSSKEILQRVFTSTSGKKCRIKLFLVFLILVFFVGCVMMIFLRSWIGIWNSFGLWVPLICLFFQSVCVTIYQNIACADEPILCMKELTKKILLI